MTAPNAPLPDLRVVAVDHLQPHEEHDSQRSAPLMERLRAAETIINPAIVTPMTETADNDTRQYVILDGANRCYAFRELGYPHILVQVVSYTDGHVELDTWRHVVSHWDEFALIDHLREVDEVDLVDDEPETVDTGQTPNRRRIARLSLRAGRVLSMFARAAGLIAQNALLRQAVSAYQRRAGLHRTAERSASAIWPYYPEAIALVEFPKYRPEDIIEAARSHAYLPPGISRHVIQGRALRVNYPIAVLRDARQSLEEKNIALQAWVRNKLLHRAVRYYAESTYMFDE
jgi:hypothetical protein